MALGFCQSSSQGSSALPKGVSILLAVITRLAVHLWLSYGEWGDVWHTLSLGQ